MRKLFLIKKKIILKSTLAVILATILFGFSTSFGMQHYYKVDFSTGLVIADRLNVRSGPGVQYKVIASVSQNEYIRVFAGVGDWYIVQVEGDYIGEVSKKYVKPIYSNTSNDQGNAGGKTTSNSNISADEKEVLNLINNQRSQYGLKPLEIDYELQRVAKIKAQDRVDNNYFAHESPVYGTPFNMIKNFGISYKTAGENIAGNYTNNGAVTAWMNSQGHRANILNGSFTYTGIGVVNSSKYGKIYVQMFIGKWFWKTSLKSYQKSTLFLINMIK